jgi:hypothetical protein
MVPLMPWLCKRVERHDDIRRLAWWDGGNLEKNAVSWCDSEGTGMELVENSGSVNVLGRSRTIGTAGTIAVG